MPREKFKTLTEQMYYVLLALQQEQCGVDIMESVRQMTDGRIRLGPGTLYTLLGDFQRAGLIEETGESGSSGGKRVYRIAAPGRAVEPGTPAASVADRGLFLLMPASA